MWLISCDTCGVVLDMNKRSFPEKWDSDTGDPIEGASKWDNERHMFVAILPCPVCGNNITEK